MTTPVSEWTACGDYPRSWFSTLDNSRPLLFHVRDDGRQLWFDEEAVYLISQEPSEILSKQTFSTSDKPARHYPRLLTKTPFFSSEGGSRPTFLLSYKDPSGDRWTVCFDDSLVKLVKLPFVHKGFQDAMSPDHRWFFEATRIDSGGVRLSRWNFDPTNFKFSKRKTTDAFNYDAGFQMEGATNDGALWFRCEEESYGCWLPERKVRQKASAEPFLKGRRWTTYAWLELGLGDFPTETQGDGEPVEDPSNDRSDVDESEAEGSESDMSCSLDEGVQDSEDQDLDADWDEFDKFFSNVTYPEGYDPSQGLNFSSLDFQLNQGPRFLLPVDADVALAVGRLNRKSAAVWLLLHDRECPRFGKSAKVGEWPLPADLTMIDSPEFVFSASPGEPIKEFHSEHLKCLVRLAFPDTEKFPVEDLPLDDLRGGVAFSGNLLHVTELQSNSRVVARRAPLGVPNFEFFAQCFASLLDSKLAPRRVLTQELQTVLTDAAKESPSAPALTIFADQTSRILGQLTTRFGDRSSLPQ